MQSIRDGKGIENSIRDAASEMVTRVFDSLVETMLSAGVTVYEACHLLRHAAVRSAEAKLQVENGRKSNSQIAAMTGLSRAEVARFLGSNGANNRNNRLSQNPIQRVLAAWHDSSHYLNKQGEPSDLPIFGARRSFEKLVAKFGSGVPVRAMLDEMTRLGVIEILPNQGIRVKSRFAINRGLNEASIRELGVRTSDLIRTLTTNITTSAPLFEASVSSIGIDPKAIPLLKREVASRSKTFLSSMEVLLESVNSIHVDKSRPAGKNRAGVGIYYFEESWTLPGNAGPKKKRRTNYKRLRKNRKQSTK